MSDLRYRSIEAMAQVAFEATPGALWVEAPTWLVAAERRRQTLALDALLGFLFNNAEVWLFHAPTDPPTDLDCPCASLLIAALRGTKP